MFNDLLRGEKNVTNFEVSYLVPNDGNFFPFQETRRIGVIRMISLTGIDMNYTVFK